MRFCIALVFVVLACKSGQTGGIPATADPASALTACGLAGLDVAGVKRIGVVVSDPAGKEEALRTRVLDAFSTGLARDRRFRPVEREQLSRVLQEQGLAASGLLSGEDAARMGGVLPVDWILSASVLQSGPDVSVSGRFLNAVDGTILHGFDCPYTHSTLAVVPGSVNSQNTTNSNNTINSNNTTNTTITNTTNTNSNNTNSNNQTTINIGVLNVTDPDKIVQKKCDREHRPILAALRNLTSDALVERAADLAMEVRFDMECGQIHFVVMDTFARYKFAPAAYTQFLLNTMDEIDDVSGDHRTGSMLRYFASTHKHVSEAEWKSGFAALLRSREGTLAGYILLLLNHKQDPSSSLDRAREILSAVDSRRLGRPVPAAPGRVFYLVLASLKFSNPAESRQFISVLEQHMDRYVLTPNALGTGYVSLLTAYYFQTDPHGKGVIRSALRKNLSVDTQVQRSHEHLFYDVAYGLEKMKNGEDNEPEPVRSEAARDLAVFLADLREPLCRAPRLYERDFNVNRDQTHFLLRNAAGCSWLPTAKDMAVKMQNGGWDEKVDAARTLVEMRENARDAEPVVIRYFKINGMTRSSELRTYCAEVLGYIRTQNPEAQGLLIAGAGDFDNPVQDASEKALARIGLLVKPAILQYLSIPRSRGEQVRETRRRMSLVQVLGRMGRGASDAIPYLDYIARNDVDSYVQTMAKNAIVNIQENRTE